MREKTTIYSLLGGFNVAEIPTPTGYSAGTKSRPLGVTILALLMMIGGILNLLGFVSPYGIIYSAYTVVTGILGLILGIAMWQLIPWARKVAIIWYIISLLLSFVMVMYVGALLDALYPGLGTMTAMIAMIPTLIISLIIILYLNSGGVKAAFQEVGGW
jgi:hypothetical protein